MQPPFENLRLEELTSLEALRQLEPHWRGLWRRCPSATPFQSPDWCIPWWEQYGTSESGFESDQGIPHAGRLHTQAPSLPSAVGVAAETNTADNPPPRSLWVLAVWRGADLLALAPLYLRHSTSTGERHVLILGTGLSDYLDILVDPEALSPSQDLLLGHLEKQAPRWDACDFRQLPPWSPCLAWELPFPWQSALAADAICPALAIDESLDLRRTVPARMMDKLALLRRRARSLGRLRCERADVSNFEELFEGFVRLHSLRWTRLGPAASLDHGLITFHKNAAGRLLAAGVLRMHALYLDARLVAASYGFCCGSRAFLYLSGFDPDYGDLGPGTLLIGHALEEAALEGAREFDFLRGRDSYKYMWGARGRVNCRRRLTCAPGGGPNGAVSPPGRRRSSPPVSAAG